MQQISNEIDALLRFYKGRKLISVTDIREFSETYQTVQHYMKDTCEPQLTTPIAER